MILTLDVGNTTICMAVLRESGDIVFHSRLSTDYLKTADQYAIDLIDILRLYDVSPRDISGSIMSCVVPQLKNNVSSAIHKITGITPLIVGPGIKTGLNIKIDNPAQLGADIVCDCVAAINRYSCPAIVVDMGTATSVSYIDGEGVYQGCAILPGLKISLDALAGRAAQLKNISLDKPISVIGKNTEDAMCAGIIYSNASIIKGMAERIRAEYNTSAPVILTGGNARYVKDVLGDDVIYDDKLLIEGLYNIYNRNTK